MKYENAKDILPEELLKQVQRYAQGKLLYVPIENENKSWGEVSGCRQVLMKRNQMICNKYMNGITISELADEYFLSLDSIKKIIYGKKKDRLEFSVSISSAIDFANAGMAEEWIQTYLMFYSDCETKYELLKNKYICFGIAKIPLRFISTDYVSPAQKQIKRYPEDSEKQKEPLIVRYETGRFFVDVQNDMLCELKSRKINACPAFILITNHEEYRNFMKNYGRHFVLQDKAIE